MSENNNEYKNEYEDEKRDYDYGYYNRPVYNQGKKKKRPFLVLILALLVIGASGLGGFFGSQFYLEKYMGNKALESSQSITIEASDDDNVVKAVAKKSLDSVVGISSTTIVRNFFNGPSELSGIGSGVIVDSRGYILTNDHVVASLAGRNTYSYGENYADDISVIINDGSQLPAKVLWSDSNLDLAILKVETDKALQPAVLGDSDALEIGDRAIAIGNPLALEFHGTVTAGFISGLNRNLPVEGGNLSMSNLIQTDAAINGGNSGGPLLNSKGEVVGINTLKIQSGEGIGFSIAINSVKPIIEQVLETGTYERVSIGFQGTEIERYENAFGLDLGVDHGVVVLQIVKGSPAQKAGLKSNDIILKINDTEIKDMRSIQNELYKYKFGDKVNLEILRDGENINLEIVFEKIN